MVFCSVLVTLYEYILPTKYVWYQLNSSNPQLYMLTNNSAIAMKISIPTGSDVKVHRSICIELQGFIERILHLILAIESARPNCSLAMQALCSLHFTLDKAKSVIKQCSNSSKLFLAITSHKILSRCQRIRNAFELYLSQIQTTVPIPLVAEISAILLDLRNTEFSLEFEDEEARKVILSLLEKNFPDTVSIENAEVEAIKTATSRLDINSQLSLLVEKATLKRQLEKLNNNNTNQKERKVVEYLLYLLIKYGKFICMSQNGRHSKKHVCDDDAICENHQVNGSINQKADL